MLPPRDSFRLRDTCRINVTGWRKIFHANINEKKFQLTILISDKLDFKTKSVKRLRITLYNDEGVNPRR